MKDQATPVGPSETPATTGRPAATGTPTGPSTDSTDDPAGDPAAEPAAGAPAGDVTDPPADDGKSAADGRTAGEPDDDEPGDDEARGWHPLLRVLTILGTVAVLVGALVVVGLRYDVAGRLFAPDRAAGARVGDCLAALPDVADGGARRSAEARTVSCSSGEAAYDVVGRVDGQTEQQVREGRQCEPFVVAGGTYYTYSSIPDGGTGYLLCLVPRG